MSSDSAPTNAPSSNRVRAIRNSLLALIAILLLAILMVVLVRGGRAVPASTASSNTAKDEVGAEKNSEYIAEWPTTESSSENNLDFVEVPSGAGDAPPPLIPGITLPQFPTNLFAGDESPFAEPLGVRRTKVRIPITAADEAAILAEDAKIPRERIATGPTAAVSLFGSPAAVGRSFVFVIDRSSSMGGDGLGALQTAAKEFAFQLEQLTSDQTFQVVAYNQSAAFLTGRELIPATSENKRELVHFVGNLAAFGQTEHVRGLRDALRLKPEVIFLLTDGGDPVLNVAQLREVRDEAAGRTTIHCVHFGRGPLSAPNNFLARLASENRGNYVYIDMDAR